MNMLCGPAWLPIPSIESSSFRHAICQRVFSWLVNIRHRKWWLNALYTFPFRIQYKLNNVILVFKSFVENPRANIGYQVRNSLQRESAMETRRKSQLKENSRYVWWKSSNTCVILFCHSSSGFALIFHSTADESRQNGNRHLIVRQFVALRGPLIHFI